MFYIYLFIFNMYICLLCYKYIEINKYMLLPQHTPVDLKSNSIPLKTHGIA